MRVLGLDPGTRRIGVALGDTDTGVATPLTVVERRRRGDEHRRAISDLAIEWEIDALIVGLPLTLAGAHAAAAKDAEAEAAALARLIRVPVALYDERLTTVTADRALRERGLDGRARRARVDAMAAAVMLQAWLDARAAGVVPEPGSPGDEGRS